MNTIQVIKDWIKKDSEVLDLGCGKGEILKELTEKLNTISLGVEIDQENINACIESGLNVVQQNINEGLDNFTDKSFDVVIMSQTIQVLKEPKKALLEVTRIGHESIVTIPNFGHWKVRLNLLFQGTMPVTKTLPNEWYNTPNIHMCTIKDFFKFSKKMDFKIFKSFALMNKNVSTINSSNLFFKNLFCELGIFLIEK